MVPTEPVKNGTVVLLCVRRGGPVWPGNSER
jgi:hypothetical protein